jgi:hypothetical protein
MLLLYGLDLIFVTACDEKKIVFMPPHELKMWRMLMTAIRILSDVELHNKQVKTHFRRSSSLF